MTSSTDPFSASIIPFEVPEQMRAFAEKGVSQARDSYAKFKDAAETHNGTIEAVFTSASKGASDVLRQADRVLQGQHLFRARFRAGAVRREDAGGRDRAVDLARPEAVRDASPPRPRSSPSSARRSRPRPSSRSRPPRRSFTSRPPDRSRIYRKSPGEKARAFCCRRRSCRAWPQAPANERKRPSERL